MVRGNTGAMRFAENTAPVIQQVRDSGITSLRSIAAILNALDVRTARGGQWVAHTGRRRAAAYATEC